MSSHDIIQELDRYCAAAGLEPSTVCRNATGNPRLRERLISKIEQADRYINSLRDYMRDNPVPSGTTEVVNDGLTFQGGASADRDTAA